MTLGELRRMRDFQHRKGLRPRFDLFNLSICITLAIIVPVVLVQFVGAKQEVQRYQVAASEVHQ